MEEIFPSYKLNTQSLALLHCALKIAPNSFMRKYKNKRNFKRLKHFSETTGNNIKHDLKRNVQLKQNISTTGNKSDNFFTFTLNKYLSICASQH